MNNASNFFIKAGYKINENAKTFETEFVGEYWTKERIETASDFQYDVYLLAQRLIIKHDFKSGIDLGCGPATKAKKLLSPILNEIIFIDQPNCESIVNLTITGSKFHGVDLENISLDLGKKFDLIVCADVLEHLNNPIPTIHFLNLKGIAIFSTPERDILRGPNCNVSPHQAHVREWNSKEFKTLLEYSGLHVARQLLLPARKLSKKEIIQRWLSKGFNKKPEWYSCQVALCKVKN
jgi:predicted TPR repeat methyltransferase